MNQFATNNRGEVGIVTIPEKPVNECAICTHDRCECMAEYVAAFAKSGDTFVVCEDQEKAKRHILWNRDEHGGLT